MDEDLREDGELSDDSCAYTPLERPAGYSAAQPHLRFPIAPESDSEIELQSTDSDSDSDSKEKKSKKPKIKLKPKLQQQNPKRKKYDIWSTRVQEDVLAETLNSCDVTKKDRSRDVESYDYLGNHFYDVRKNNKRSREDRKNTGIRMVGRSRSEDKGKGSPRTIPELAVTANSTTEEIAKDMANKLCEEKEDLIQRVVDSLGKEKAFSIFKETKRIEEEGGMLIMNQTRRRTPGGVFLFLIRHDDDITSEQKEAIFESEKEKTKVMIKNKQKKKLKKMKERIVFSKLKLLPELPTRAELLANEKKKSLQDTDERDVINPPPTPETDCHENSADGMEGFNVNDSLGVERRKLETYDDDYLEIGSSADMDLF